MFSSLKVKGILSQTVYAAYPIVCFPVFSSSHFFYVKILFRCISGIVFADITGILKIV